MIALAGIVIFGVLLAVYGGSIVTGIFAMIFGWMIALFGDYAFYVNLFFSHDGTNVYLNHFCHFAVGYFWFVFYLI
jgi:hypothetical protein